MRYQTWRLVVVTCGSLCLTNLVGCQGEIKKEGFYEDELFGALEDCQHRHHASL